MSSTSAAPTSTLPPTAAATNPRSVTFVSERTGWVLVGCATCPSRLLQTRDGGMTWSMLPAEIPAPASPETAGPPQSVRFADLQNGWIFGPDLLVTHDGGARWSRPALPGLGPDDNVAALETSAGRVHVVVYPSDFSSARILSSPVDHDAWQASSTTIPIGAGPVPGTQIVLHGTAGWIVQVDRTVVGGAILRGGQWAPWTPPCSDTYGSASLAASDTSHVVAVCDEGIWGGGPPMGVHLYTSDNAGATFRRTAEPIPSGGVEVATPVAGTVFVEQMDGSSPALAMSTDGGRHWQPVYHAPDNSALTELGFTSSRQGVAIQTELHDVAGSLLQTTDSGHTWRTVKLVSG
jgi:photosystem II stability/assembly factor-like uncharacterized protein